MSAAPIVLLDNPEEELCDERGWVEATSRLDAARDALVEFVFDDEGQTARPVGEPKRVWLAPEAADYVDEARWTVVEEGTPGAVEFFEFDVTDCQAVEPPKGAKQ